MATTSKRYQLTPEQVALSEERKAKKLKSTALQQNNNAGRIIERCWIPTGLQSGQQGDQRVKVFTWNPTPAVGPVSSRELFPTSDCLKANQREQMLYRELLSTQADILCLQEVDRLEKIIPALNKAGYAHHYAAGPGKKHGCLIAFKKQLYTMISAKTILYDVEEVRSDGDDAARRGKSFETKNIGSLVSLQSNTAGKAEGLIVATTHLFWHPRYTYERARQAGILVRETNNFRKELDVEHWPCIIGGDFNFAPDDIAYSLLVGDSILSEQKDVITPSYVVHMSVDPSAVPDPRPEAGEGNEESGDPDKVITSARAATPSDGLLSLTELSNFFARIPRLRSAYDVGLARIKNLSDLQTFGSRVNLGSDRRGRYEPEYTSYTHYWKTTLDYIFVLDPIDRESNVVALLSPHRTKDLEHGLPQTGVSSSDHVSLAAEFCWSRDKLTYKVNLSIEAETES
ncbi:putative RNA exonuclease C9B6.11c [Termitomyces sp. T112]|nr:hypothetical protein C0989_002216 [Termitomyces sp. Mn162]KAG5731611.1 putative RNA exonuclease C9B6.11c [Termitomyces sp. T112]